MLRSHNFFYCLKLFVQLVQSLLEVTGKREQVLVHGPKLHFGEVRLVVVLSCVFQKVLATLPIVADWARRILNRDEVSVVVHGLVVVKKWRNHLFFVVSKGVIAVSLDSELQKQLLYFLLVFKVLRERRFLFS